jgi:diguanylate cyclase (GGDEF)-like protein
MRTEDAFLDLLVDTLEGLDRPARGQFLRRFFRQIAQVELSPEVSLDYWEEVLERRRHFSESLGKPISLKSALISVLASTDALRLPILMEYEELKRLQINAATDELTGLYNRRLFEEYLAKELNRAQRYRHHLALVILDLHQFKEVNDRYGHLQGDRVLQAVGKTLWRTLRASDYAFRIGGDEFALLLPETHPEQATTIAQRVRANFEALVGPLQLDPLPMLDYGVAVFPIDGEQRETLMGVADERLYRMKQPGRGAIPPADEAPPAPVPPQPEAPPEPPEPPAKPPKPERAKAAPPAAPRAERRKWERVSLGGTRAYATLGGEGGPSVPVLDLSYGGVALEFDQADDAPAVFQAVLHVPILPPVKVSLRRTYVQRGVGKTARVGCAFVS